MNFRAFIEQGTQPSTTGIGAGGRAGQTMAKPEKMWSPFSPSDKFKTNNRPGSPLSPRGIDATPVYTPISPLSPHGIASKKPTIDPNKSFGQGQIPSIQVKPNSTK